MQYFKVHDMWGIFTGAFVLVAVYLILTNWLGANSLLNTLFTSGINGVKALQGR